MTIQLKGITWNHTRGYLPLVATSQRFMETHPGVQITWEKRSLQEFADFPIQSLIDRYDLLVIDHPWAGYASQHKVLVSFNEHVPPQFLADQSANSVGASHSSYNLDGCQTALAIDAATPVSSCRPDLLVKYDLQQPQTWNELIALAKRSRVAIPAIPIDSLMNWYMFCIALGEEPFVSREHIVTPDIGAAALEHLRELASHCSKEIFDWNPIAVYEALSTGEELVYCPFAYGYSNYSRPGYSKHVLEFGDLVTFGNTGRLRSTLGGTGLAISASSKHTRTAVEYAMYTASATIQRTLYVESGGQPGHRAAWLEWDANARCRDYFTATLPTLDRAYVRPRYNGYLHFQDHAGDYVHEYMKNGGNTSPVLERMNDLYRESLSKC
jgi:multiple sugar transport system substrate-binding protein